MLFYSEILKSPENVFQIHEFQPETSIKYGDVTEYYIPRKGPLLSKLFLNMQSYDLSNLEYFEFWYAETCLYRFTGEYLNIDYLIKTPFQKQILNDNIIQLPIHIVPVLDNMKIRFSIKSPLGKTGSENFQVSGEFIYTKKNTDGDYLIQQVQTSSFTQVPIFLNFKNAVKELFFTFDGIQQSSERITEMSLTLNGVEKFKDSGMFFRLVQPLMYHTCASVPPNYIYSYSFSLEPENEKPMGSINMSVLHNVVFSFKSTTPVKTINIHAVSYNILRVQGAQGKLLFMI